MNVQPRTHFNPEMIKKGSLLLLRLEIFSTSLIAENIKLEYTGILDRIDTAVAFHFAPGNPFSGTLIYSTSKYNVMITDPESAN